MKKCSIIILGTIQDAGSPHIGCKRSCCIKLLNIKNNNRKIVSLGLIDHENKKSYLFEATPDITDQISLLNNYLSYKTDSLSNGIFITHSHIGHYTGLMYLGKEASNIKKMPVYVMKRMKQFIENNGPWNQLIKENNIVINQIQKNMVLNLTSNISIMPIEVPHRNEYSETSGFIIMGPNSKLLFIPDIDKWAKWEMDIVDAISRVDYALIDGTFFNKDEIINRNISEIPHPFIEDTMEIFKDCSLNEKKKIFFTHFNHTNPVLDPNSRENKEVQKKGFQLSQFQDIINL